MALSDLEIERKYRDKSSAYASGMIVGGGMAAVAMLLMCLAVMVVISANVARCASVGGTVLETLEGASVCVVIQDKPVL